MLPRNRGRGVKLILTQFRNCAAPAGRLEGPAGAVGTRRRSEPGGRPAPVPGHTAPRACSCPPRAARPAPQGGPGSPARPLGAPPRRVLGERGRPGGAAGVCERAGSGCAAGRSRPNAVAAPAGGRSRRGEEPGGRRGAARGASAGSGVGSRLAPAAGVSGLGAGLGAGPGGQAAPPLRRVAG